MQGLAHGLGITDAVASPTYTYVHRHAGRLALVHVDLYRIARDEDLDDLGWEELGDARTVFAVEWGDRMGPYLPEDRLELELAAHAGEAGEDGNGESRSLTFRATGPAARRLLDALGAEARR